MFMRVCITNQNNFKYEYMRKVSTIKLHFSNKFKNNFLLLNFILTFLLLGQSDFDGSVRLSIIPVF